MRVQGGGQIAAGVRGISAVLALSLLVGCAGIAKSRVNPLNWFKKREATVAEFSIETPADPRALIDTVTLVKVEDVPTGIILRAVGRSDLQGAWQADLVARPVEDGKLVLEFRAFAPAADAAVGPTRSREVTVALHLRRAELDGVRQILVQGAGNALSVKP